MFFLRILSFLAGSFVLMGAPFFMLSERAGLASGNVALVLLGSAAVCAFGVAYFVIALYGHRTIRSVRLRQLVGALLAYQLLAGALVLALSSHVDLLMTCGTLMCLSVFLFLAFVYPGQLARSHRPMRRREQRALQPN